MIGNDIVDLDLARKESNCKRKGFLDKIFSQQEQCLILNNSNPETMVWNLWSRKEAAYKIYNRETGISGYFPRRLQCHYEDEISGTVSIDGFVFYTQTYITEFYIYSIAVSKMDFFSKIKTLDSLENIKKENGIPYILDAFSNAIAPVSITHHGRFQRIIALDW
ncbi:4'-phosphopantetheinyl transferase superfamily protein [Flavobacterium sp. M31R6]|uniref:4'-phosphopantetheinyl transferase family protein n=1 Tax=Flavobacterium sp. M31R6 TaxID=2739062 RepID=UPI00156826A3|nr:4'-phosphopantetheinyl transferase superfamily protein [Flavobacterium sp. M31R6]QKJ63840.1 4'-phosphopantetheinyl transferase superfamily protein [Flavobacterium sp. M31R6]